MKDWILNPECPIEVANLTNLLEILGFPIPLHTAILVCLVMAHPTISQYISDLHQLLMDNLG